MEFPLNNTKYKIVDTPENNYIVAAYIGKVARNAMRNKKRRQYRHEPPLYFEDKRSMLEFVVDPIDYENHVICKIQLEIIEKAVLPGLTEVMQDVFRKYFYYDMTPSEIAKTRACTARRINYVLKNCKEVIELFIRKEGFANENNNFDE